MCVFLSNVKKPKFHAFEKIRARSVFGKRVTLLQRNSHHHLSSSRAREKERERERKEHTHTHNLKPRERTTHKKSRHRHVFCATTTTTPVVEFDFDLLRNDQKNTVRKIRHQARFFFFFSLSLCLSRLGSGCFATRSSSRRGLLLYFTFSSFSSSSSSSSSRWWWWWEMREKRDPKDRDPRGIFKSAWFFCPKCDSATRRIQRIHYIQNARFRRRKVVRVTLN